MSLGANDFTPWFLAVHGVKPFPWQQALAKRLCDGEGWPERLALPTGAGKTAAIDAAVFHLAVEAERGAARTAALRIVLVVDRRLQVDAAWERARAIARTLAHRAPGAGPGHPVVAAVAARLAALAGPDAPPLATARLHAGAPLAPDWARSPTQPTVVAATVDQAGSRLLHRGYGVAERMRSLHAGLLGADTVYLVDEAHRCEPFLQTLEAVRGVGRADIRTVVLGGAPGPGRGTLKLGAADRRHPVLRRRLAAPKPVRLHRAVDGPGQALDDALLAEAARLGAALRADGGRAPAVAIVANRVDRARRIFEALPDDDTTRVLLIGRARGTDRERLEALLAPYRTDAERPGEGLTLVSTQCLEVGTDLDLDAVVSEAAPLDALVQRFGRLNRGGRPVRARGAILAAAADVAPHADDALYADRTARTWSALEAIAEDDTVDFSHQAQCAWGPVHDAVASTPPDAPVVFPDYLDRWSRTSPPPAPDPAIGLFLHGAERTGAGVTIAWRADLTPGDLARGASAELAARMALAPPNVAETVEVPVWAARAWLRGSGGPGPAHTGDVAERAPRKRPGARAKGRPVLRLASAGRRRGQIVLANALRRGDTLVAPSAYGGCDPFGWAPASTAPVRDDGHRAARRGWPERCALRLTAATIAEPERWAAIRDLLASDGLSDAALVTALARELLAHPDPDLRHAAEHLAPGARRVDLHFAYGPRRAGAVLVAEHGLGGHRRRYNVPVSEDDWHSHRARAPITIRAHAGATAAKVRRTVDVLGLERSVGDDLTLAAWLHDAGKADRRVQAVLAGRRGRPLGSEPLAKSHAPWRPGAAERAGLPPGWRHEALSVRLARGHPAFARAHDPQLVLWLIGTHHGLGRPFFGFTEDAEPTPAGCLGVDEWRLDGPGPQSLAFDFEGDDWPGLFARLKARYGIWGLAHLEAIVRLGDHRASQDAQP